MDDPHGPYERKVQLTGGTTYTVSLPKAWANEQGLDTGSLVHLYTRGDRLLVTQPDADASRRTVSLSASRYDPSRIGRAVAAAYVAGADTVHVTDAPGREARAAVRDAVAGLVGIEVATESDGEVVARTMLDVADLSPKQTLAQMQGMALSMHEEAIEAALSGNEEEGRRIAGQDDTVDRLFGLVAREFQQSLVDVRIDGAGDGLTTFDYYTVARQIERVGDHAEKIAGTAALIDAEPPADLAADIARVAGDARAVVADAVAAALGDRDPDALGRAVADGERVVEATAALDRRLYEQDLANGYPLATVLDSVGRTAEYGINVAEAGLQASLRRADADPMTSANAE